MKILTILGICISFGFTVDSMASSCSGISVEQCSPGSGGVPSGQTCSGYYLSPKPIYNNNHEVQIGTEPGTQCSGSVNDCSNDGLSCS